jgi:hypothetical protein
MVPISSLWIPILLSAVIVFVASFILHMVLTYHRNDFKKLPNEDGLMEAFRKESIATGHYAAPHCREPKDMKSPEIIEKFTKGPVFFVTVIPSGPPAMGKNLALWFFYSIGVSIFVAYIAGRTLSAGTDYLTVFRVAGTIAFLGYGFGYILDSIWKGQPWSSTFKHIFDGLVYGLLTAGTFGWLWPR